jgi:hypothetical protein
VDGQYNLELPIPLLPEAVTHLTSPDCAWVVVRPVFRLIAVIRVYDEAGNAICNADKIRDASRRVGRDFKRRSGRCGRSPSCDLDNSLPFSRPITNDDSELMRIVSGCSVGRI